MSSSNSTPRHHAWLRRIDRWGWWSQIGSAVRAALLRLRRRRVPVMLQLSTFECGAACLAMILSYYGRKTRVAECRECIGVGRDGITASTLTKTARSQGLRVKAFSLEPEDLRYVQLPAIAHWGFSHFVVVERWSPQQVEIVDPAAGRRRLSATEFSANFTGVLLTFEPGAQFAPRQTTDHLFWFRYLRYILGHPGVLSQIVGASLLLQLFGLALPIFTKLIVDQIIPHQIASIMPLLGIGMLILVLAQIVTSYLRTALLIYLQARLDSQMMLGFFDHLLVLPFRFFEQRTSGDLLMRMSSNMVVRETLTSQTLSIILDGMLVLGYLAILLAQAPAFGLLVLGIGLLQIVLLMGTTRWTFALTQRDLAAQSESQSYLVEVLKGIATLKASGVEDRVFDHWTNLFFKQLNISLQRNHLSVVVDTTLMALRMFSSLILLWVGTQQVLNGTLSLGTMLALLALAAAFMMPLSSLVSNGQRLQLVGAHLDRIADVLEAEPEQDLQAVQPAPKLTGRIELKDVSFRYDPNSPLALRAISVTIEPGQKVAIVGRTGSGKSTLARLLLGLYTPTEGDILYDDLPLQRMDYRTLRNQCGVVLQEPSLFSGTVRQYITFNDADRSFDDLVRAAKMAEIHDEIAHMPMGYETLIGEGSSGLSGGQRQRLALARALAHHPAILLLDEATSHLDVVTERLVDQHLSELACTRVVVAHRLSTVRNADLILVLDNQTIVERGSHEALLQCNGVYAALVGSQLAEEGVARDVSPAQVRAIPSLLA